MNISFRRTMLVCFLLKPQQQNAFFYNERWWSLADADYKSELASTCGCH